MQLTGHHPFGKVDSHSQVSTERIGFEEFPCRRDALQDQRLCNVIQEHADWVRALLLLQHSPLISDFRKPVFAGTSLKH